MIQETIQTRLREAIKARDEDGKNLYRFLKGLFDNHPLQPVPDDVAIRVMRSYLKEAKSNPEGVSFTDREVQLLGELVPQELDQSACRQFLEEKGLLDQIRFAPSDGMAMGIAMKAFASGKRLVDSLLVKDLVAELRR